MGVPMRAGSRGQISGAINRLFRAGTAVGLSDGQLLERFIQGHDEGAESAFNVLLERHGAMVLAVCHRVLHDPHDAQDAFQATFLVLPSVYRRGRSPKSAKPECLGRVQIVSIELDSAMAELIASEGKMINEGDCVSTQMARLSVDQ